jgi:hypothetical protein
MQNFIETELSLTIHHSRIFCSHPNSVAAEFAGDQNSRGGLAIEIEGDAVTDLLLGKFEAFA